jgi:hypothetical protein
VCAFQKQTLRRDFACSFVQFACILDWLFANPADFFTLPACSSGWFANLMPFFHWHRKRRTGLSAFAAHKRSFVVVLITPNGLPTPQEFFNAPRLNRFTAASHCSGEFVSPSRLKWVVHRPRFLTIPAIQVTARVHSVYALFDNARKANPSKQS